LGLLLCSSSRSASDAASAAADPFGGVLQTGASPVGPWLQDHDDSLPGSECRTVVKLRVTVAPTVPQSRPFRTICSSRPDGVSTPGKFDAAFGMRLEVEPPGRIVVRTTVHRHRDQVRTILELAEDHPSLLTRTTASGRQTHHSIAVGLRTPQSESATGDAVQAAVRGPGETNEPSRRIRAGFSCSSDIGCPVCDAAESI
jgi:hypothetical protein